MIDVGKHGFGTTCQYTWVSPKKLRIDHTEKSA